MAFSGSSPERERSGSWIPNGSESFVGNEGSEAPEGAEGLGTVYTPVLNAAQRAKLEALSELVRSAAELNLTPTEKAWMDEACLSRFLRARRYHVQKAFRQLHETIVWRRSFGVEQLMLDPELADVKRQSETGKLYVHGKDRFGRPAVFMKPRLQNTSERKTAHEQMRQLVYTLERAVAEMVPPVEKICLVIDFPGYSLRNAPSIKVQRQTLKILQDYYPERLGFAVCIDAPAIFWTFFEIVKPFIDRRTSAKIQFCSRKAKEGTKQNMRTLMNQLFDPEALEIELGGRSAWRYSNEEYFRERVLPEYLRIKSYPERVEMIPCAEEDVNNTQDVFYDSMSCLD